jgi:hypothetical protein
MTIDGVGAGLLGRMGSSRAAIWANGRKRLQKTPTGSRARAPSPGRARLGAGGHERSEGQARGESARRNAGQTQHYQKNKAAVQVRAFSREYPSAASLALAPWTSSRCLPARPFPSTRSLVAGPGMTVAKLARGNSAREQRGFVQ